MIILANVCMFKIMLTAIKVGVHTYATHANFRTLHIESSHSLHQNDAKLQKYPPPVTSKCQICQKSMFIISNIKLV